VPAHSPAPDCLSHKDNSKGRAKFHQRAASAPAEVPFVTTNVLRWKLDLKAMKGDCEPVGTYWVISALEMQAVTTPELVWEEQPWP